jgi:hypothetical protein
LLTNNRYTSDETYIRSLSLYPLALDIIILYDYAYGVTYLSLGRLNARGLSKAKVKIMEKMDKEILVKYRPLIALCISMICIIIAFIQCIYLYPWMGIGYRGSLILSSISAVIYVRFIDLVLKKLTHGWKDQHDV